MATQYPKRAFEILREEGPVELSKSSIKFILSQLDPRHHRRFRFHTLKNHLQNCILYDAPAKPYSIIEVNPNDIEYRHGSATQISKTKGLGQVKGGKWDKKPDTFDGHPTYEGVIQRFDKGMRWKDTKYVQNQVAKYERDGKCSWGHETPEAFIQNRCQFVDNLYRSMKNEGYIYSPNQYTNKEMDDTNLGREYTRLKPRHKLEPLIAISRNGEYILREGHHRSTIAKILDMDAIPVNVLCRHKQWQELRDEIHNNGLPEGHEDLREHPDLQDILN